MVFVIMVVLNLNPWKEGATATQNPLVVHIDSALIDSTLENRHPGAVPTADRNPALVPEGPGDVHGRLGSDTAHEFFPLSVWPLPVQFRYRHDAWTFCW